MVSLTVPAISFSAVTGMTSVTPTSREYTPSRKTNCWDSVLQVENFSQMHNGYKSVTQQQPIVLPYNLITAGSQQKGPIAYGS